jgi:ribosomal protein L10
MRLTHQAAQSQQVHNARTRANKEEVVEQLKGKLEKSIAVYGLRFKGLNVRELVFARAESH